MRRSPALRRLGLPSAPLAAALLVSCASEPTPPVGADPGSLPAVSTGAAGPATAGGAAPTTTTPPTTAAPATTAAPTTTAAPAAAALPPYEGRVALVDDAVRARMTHSWRPGCPVGIEELRHVVVGYWGTDGQPHTGELIAHAAVADDLVVAFERLWDARFPIERMELVDVYGGDDDTSMRANNTSAFNCREIDGQPGTWSHHAFGRAIDINPLVNPWVRGSQVDPVEGAPYVDRTQDVPGLIRDGDVVVAAFTELGWRWGGHWRSSKDYQHFDKV